MCIRDSFKIYLFRQFCSNRVKFFYNTQETQAQKMLDQNFEIRILWFLRIFKFSKRRGAIPLRPIWTIMVAAKLDQSRVLVTKWQNRLTLKGRSAGQRHTDRQTNSAENNGPSGLQSGQKFDTTKFGIPLTSLYNNVQTCKPKHTQTHHYCNIMETVGLWQQFLNISQDSSITTHLKQLCIIDTTGNMGFNHQIQSLSWAEGLKNTNRYFYNCTGSPNN